MYKPNTIKCPKCGRDTGLSSPLYMVIPPEGIKCPCGQTVLHGSYIELIYNNDSTQWSSNYGIN